MRNKVETSLAMARLDKGLTLYKLLKDKYGQDVHICFCPHTGTGDIYMIGQYFDSFLQNENIEKYVFLFRGIAEKKVGALFGIKFCEIIDLEQAYALSTLLSFIGEDNLDLHLLHHFPFTPQTEITGWFEGYRGVTFEDMFINISLNLKGKIYKKRLPIFSTDTQKIERIFKENGLKKNKTVFLIPHTSSVDDLPNLFWEKLANYFLNLGYSVVSNATKASDAVKGTVPLFLDYEDIVPFVNECFCVIGIRSGLCDIISSACCHKVILAPYSWNVAWLGHQGKTLKFFGLKNNRLSENKIYDLEFRAEELYKLDLEIEKLLKPYIDFSEQVVKKIDLFPKEILPYFDDCKVAISLVFDGNYVPFAAVTLQSILDNMDLTKKYDFIFFVDKVDERDLLILRNMVTNYQNAMIRFVNISKIFSKYSFHVERGYKPITYARIIIPDALKKYDMVVYLDSDIMVREDILKICNFDFSDKPLGAVIDSGMVGWYNTLGHLERKNMKNRLCLKWPNEYFNAGVLVINIEEFCKYISSKQLFNYAISRKWHWQDQDILVSLFEGKTKLLPLEWNCLIIDRNDIEMIRKSQMSQLAEKVVAARKNPKIVHFLGMQVLDLNFNIPRRQEYFAYANKTSYAGLINSRICPKRPTVKLTIIKRIKVRIRRIVDVFFPKGTIRRERLKKIYHKLRRK